MTVALIPGERSPLPVTVPDSASTAAEGKTTYGCVVDAHNIPPAEYGTKAQVNLLGC